MLAGHRERNVYVIRSSSGHYVGDFAWDSFFQDYKVDWVVHWNEAKQFKTAKSAETALNKLLKSSSASYATLTVAHFVEFY